MVCRALFHLRLDTLNLMQILRILTANIVSYRTQGEEHYLGCGASCGLTLV